MVKGHDSLCTSFGNHFASQTYSRTLHEVDVCRTKQTTGALALAPKTQPSTHSLGPWELPGPGPWLVAAVPHHPSLCYISFSWVVEIRDAPSLTTESGCHLFLQAKTPILSHFTRACSGLTPHFCLALGVAGRPSVRKQGGWLTPHDHPPLHLHLPRSTWLPSCGSSVLEALVLLGTTSKMSSLWAASHEVAKAARASCAGSGGTDQLVM